jgi:hypothetical protein
MPKLSKDPKRRSLHRPQVEHRCYTIPEFCVAHRISESGYYKIRKDGRGPKEKRAVGKRPIITEEAAAEWRCTDFSDTPAE